MKQASSRVDWKGQRESGPHLHQRQREYQKGEGHERDHHLAKVESTAQPPVVQRLVDFRDSSALYLRNEKRRCHHPAYDESKDVPEHKPDERATWPTLHHRGISFLLLVELVEALLNIFAVETPDGRDGDDRGGEGSAEAKRTGTAAVIVHLRPCREESRYGAGTYSALSRA